MYLIETEEETWRGHGWCFANSQHGFIVGTDLKTFRFDDEDDAKGFTAFLQDENIVYVYHGHVVEH